ncbi:MULTISPECIES: thioesterase II family protein [unclassified Streptomyces]|uniref:thioesterase II family protein n=1 Tax=unclassified Streptomyces TaxID=2593676 RepID=UPI0038177499
MELRLFVFHHAGGSHLMYRDWPALFPSGWDVRTPDVPGRGPLDDRLPLADVGAVVDHFVAELGDQLTGNFALFGHSMGGVVAYELTRRLLAESRTPPVWLGLSARGATRIDEASHRHLLSDAALRRAVAALGGTPQAVLDDPDLWGLFEPTIRGDLRLGETWSPAPTALPATVPVSAFGGRYDQTVPPEQLDGWSTLAERFLGLHLFDGGHFYFRDDPSALIEQITQDAGRALALAKAATAVPR